MANGIEPYLIDNTTQEENALKKLAEETLKHDWKVVLFSDKFARTGNVIGHVEGMFLRQIVALANCKNILKLGYFQVTLVSLCPSIAR